MLDDIAKASSDFDSALASANTSQALDDLRVHYFGRKDRKGEFRTLWIARINAAARLNGMSYSQLIAGLKLAGNTLDRKVLADIAVHDAPAFTAIAESARGALNKQQLRAALDKETATKRTAKPASA